MYKKKGLSKVSNASLLWSLKMSIYVEPSVKNIIANNFCYTKNDIFELRS